jgi:hypothetical protein
LDATNHQTGVVVTLQFDSGSIFYTFNYINVAKGEINSNNLLADVSCANCEVYPAINEKDTSYKLYIPSDMTQLTLNVTPQDVGAYCKTQGTVILNEEQETQITVTVIASDTSTRTYTFDVKRLDKTTAQVQQAMADPEFDTLVKGQLFYQKPVFAITIGAIAGGIVLLAVFVYIAKRLTVKVGDDDEVDFFAK